MSSTLANADARVLVVGEPDSHPRFRHRWQWLLGVLVALGVLVGSAPMLVAHSPLLDWIVGLAAADLCGKVSIRSASLGWFTPPAFWGVEVCDAAGQPVVEIPSVAGDKSLVALLWSRSNLGQFRLQNPKLTLVLRDDGSNVEDLLAKYLAAPRTTSQPLGVQVQITDGQVMVRDPKAQRSWQIDAFQLALRLPAGDRQGLELRAAGSMIDGQHPGRFDVALKTGQGADGASGSSSGVAGTIKADNLPLAMLAPVLARLNPKTRLDGWLGATVQGQADDVRQINRASLQGEIIADQFVLAAPQLGTDQVALERLQTTCQLALKGRRVQVDRLAVRSDVGGFSATGSVDLASASSPAGGAGVARVAGAARTPGAERSGAPGTPDATASLRSATCEIQGHIDLARLAAMLPSTLRIREETRVTSGQLQVSLASRPGPDGMTWQGRLDARNLTAENQGRRLAWPQPILVVLAARQSAQGLVVDNLRCESDFLKIDGSGTAEEFTATAAWDLNRLVAQLEGLVDFGGLRLAGEGWAKLHWRQPAGQNFSADGQLQVQDFRLALPDQPPWTEKKLWASFSASGRAESFPEARLETAMLEVKAAEDYLHAQLVQPVPDLRRGAWSLAIHSGGDFAQMLPRLSPWLTVAGWHLAGTYEFRGHVTGTPQSIYLSHSRLTAEQLQVQGPGWNIQEAQTEVSADGGWDQTRRRLELKSFQLVSTSLAASGQSFVVGLPPDGPAELAGAIRCQGDLERWQQCMTDRAKPVAWRVAGHVAGQIEFQPTPAKTTARVDAVIDNLAIAHVSGQQFQEAQVRLVGQGSYEPRTGVVTVEQAELSSSMLGATAAGQYVPKDNRGSLDLDGKVHYDLEKLSALLRSYLGGGIYAAGRGSTPAAYHGPLGLAGARASAGFGWQWINLYGFEIGPGEVQATLANDMLQVRPLDLAVSEGRVRLAPQLALSEQPMTFTLPPGKVAEQIRINPTMCAHALQYVAPILAGVATAEGRFSIELEACRIPLAEPARGDLAGRMTIHSAQVGPGPLVQELAVLLDRPGPAQLARESVIPFRMVDGRVYHQNVAMIFPEVTIRTSGSVGLDQTLALVAEMPVPPKWIGNNVVGSALRNQIIRLPIAGTLTRPAIDRPALAQLSRQFMRNAAQNVLQDQLNKHQDQIRGGLDKLNQGLDRLLGPRQKAR